MNRRRRSMDERKIWRFGWTDRPSLGPRLTSLGQTAVCTRRQEMSKASSKIRWRSNLWTYAGASSLGSDAREGLAVHPTVKPRAMLEDALLDVSARDDIVLEPFAGSGSTLIAAEAT